MNRVPVEVPFALFFIQFSRPFGAALCVINLSQEGGSAVRIGNHLTGHDPRCLLPLINPTRKTSQQPPFRLIKILVRAKHFYLMAVKQLGIIPQRARIISSNIENMAKIKIF